MSVLLCHSVMIWSHGFEQFDVRTLYYKLQIFPRFEMTARLCIFTAAKKDTNNIY